MSPQGATPIANTAKGTDCMAKCITLLYKPTFFGPNITMKECRLKISKGKRHIRWNLEEIR
jgi:hypothetical protein